MKYSYKGAYLHEPSTLHSKLQIVGITLLVLLLLGTAVWSVFLHTDNKQITYRLPSEEIPQFAVPHIQYMDISLDSDKDKDMVATAYEFTIETDYGSFEVSCPVIRAEFGEQTNEFIISELNHLVSCVQYAADNAEELPVTELSYQAYYAQDVLTLVLMETLEGGKQKSFAWLYDLKENRELGIHELPMRYLDISYAEFLYATDKYITERYSENYSSALQYLPDTVIVEQQHHRNQSYIQTDPLNMLSRYVIPTEEGPYLLYELLIVAVEYDYEVPTKVMIEPAEGLFKYIDLVEPQEAVRELLFDTIVSVMGADDQIHAEMVRTAFGEYPEAFVAAATEDPDYAIQKLLLYISQEEQAEIFGIFSSLKIQHGWSKAEMGVIDQILADLDEDMQGRA